MRQLIEFAVSLFVALCVLATCGLLLLIALGGAL